ncbi:sugar phosphate isomerase/epimerase [candidate division KSB1 bacterium]|nr:sugar phosphate isomerase/epimerase [candidate division KSB1 bacterium]
MLETGSSALEVDYRISHDEFLKIKKRLKSSEFQVLTVHNFCPIPKDYPAVRPSGDFFMLSSLDADERALAVKYSIQTIRHAADLEAKLVVFHLGQVDMDSELEKVHFGFCHRGELDGDGFKNWFNKKLAERQGKAVPYFDAVLKCLDPIHEEAYKLGVLVGVENRYRFNQIPFRKEFDIIFKKFAGGKMRYWHDVGHAELFHRLKIDDHKTAYLDRYGDILGGMHIHDILELKDHLAPGKGTFDFGMLLPYLNKSTIRILEVHEQATAEDMREAIEVMRRVGVIGGSR